MSKIPTTHYTTRVQLAAPPDLAVHFYKLLHTCTDFQILNETLTDGASRLGNIHVTRPDILMLDVLLPSLELKAVFKALGGLRYPPYVIITAPRYDSHLAQSERYLVVKGTLLHGLATSPLLTPVMKGMAEGHEYFTPEAALNLRFSDLTHEETVLRALMHFDILSFPAVFIG